MFYDVRDLLRNVLTAMLSANLISPNIRAINITPCTFLAALLQSANLATTIDSF